MVLYHGSSNEEHCRSIAKTMVLNPAGKGRGWMSPMPGCVYMTKSLDFVMAHVIGGAMAGVEGCEKHLPKSSESAGRYGCLAIIDDRETHTVQPDEDEVGELLDPVMKPKRPSWLLPLAERTVSPNLLRRAGEYPFNSRLGKALIRKMSSEEKKEILKYTKNVAFCGPAKVKELWMFDKHKCDALKRDGSNFFSLAEEKK